MALLTLGTNATTSLSSMVASGDMAEADIAAFQALIKNDLGNTSPIIPGSFSQQNLLYIPNRGVLQVRPGDYVAVDSATGWPILISAKAIASGPYTHS